MKHNIRYRLAAKDFQLIENQRKSLEMLIIIVIKLILPGYLSNFRVNSDGIITLPFQIAYPIEYSTKKIFDFVQLGIWIRVFPKLKMRNYEPFLRIGSLRKNYNQKLEEVS